MIKTEYPQEHDWCQGRMIECARLLKKRIDILWNQETMTRREVMELQEYEQLISRIENAGYESELNA